MGVCGLVMKIVAAVILLIALAVGAHAHFESSWFDMDKKTCEALSNIASFANSVNGEKVVSECPFQASTMEIISLVIMGLVLVVSIVMIIIGLIVGAAKIKTCDAGYCVFAGILILLAGIMMIVSAVLIQNFMKEIHKFQEQEMEKIRPGPETATSKSKIDLDDLLYLNKIAAGAIAILDAILYFVAAGIICCGM